MWRSNSKTSRALWGLLAATAMLLTSCDVLEETPESAISSEQFYQTADDAEAAVNAIYADLTVGWNMYPRNFYLTVEMPTDDAQRGAGVGNQAIVSLDNYTFTPTNNRLDGLWRIHYRAINRANIAIANIPDVEMEETRRSRLVAEARFLRGLFYFNLVRFFGGVPLPTEPTTSLGDVDAGRASEQEVYQQVVEDLQFAVQNLPATYGDSDNGRATSGSAIGLLSKVNLTMENWSTAAEQAEQVIAEGHCALLPSYEDVFEVDNNEEILFSVQFEPNDGLGGYEVRLVFPRNITTRHGITGYAADVPRPAFYEAFQEGDLRRDVTFLTELTNDQGEVIEVDPHWGKYADPETMTFTNNSDIDFPILRCAEIYLVYAEAVNEMSGPTPQALEYLNMVRRRGFGHDASGDSEVDYSAGMSQQAFREAVYLERRLELGNEAKRRFDLVRTGRLIDVLHEIGVMTAEEHHTLYPIPQREMDTNPNLEQNPGY